MLREFETAIADQIFNATTWTPTAVTNEWDDFTNATPITDVNARVKAMWEATGIWANSLIINKRVFRNLRQCDDITEKIRSIDPKFQGEVGIDHLRQAFDLPNIIVAGSAKNSAGQPNLTIAPVWSDEYAAVARIAETDNIKEPCVGRTFHWSEDGSSIGGTAETYREENVRGNVVRCRLDVDRKLLYTAALQLLSNITT